MSRATASAATRAAKSGSVSSSPPTDDLRRARERRPSVAAVRPAVAGLESATTRAASPHAVARATTVGDGPRGGLDEHDDPEVGQVAQGELDVGRVDLGGSVERRLAAPGRLGPRARHGRRPGRIAQDRHVPDTGSRQVLQDGIGRSVIADPTDDLHRAAGRRGRHGDARRRCHLRRGARHPGARWASRRRRSRG